VIVVFDWNGTVVLDRDRARHALNATLGERGLPQVPAAEFGTAFRLPMATMFADLGVAPTQAAAAEAEWNRHVQDTPTTLRDGTREGLARLAGAGVRLGVVSAAAAESVRRDCLELDVPDVWSVFQAPAVDKTAVLAGLSTDGGAWYVGDTVYDMECAVAAGFVPVGVAGGYAAPEALRAAGAEHLVEDVREIASLVLDR
jgi:phosphoglycolate phosphatase